MRAVNDSTRLRNVISQAGKKLHSVTGNTDHLKDLSSRVNQLLRMLKAHVSGEFSAFSGRTLLLITFALLYFIVPTDAVPDFIPALGFSDDISVLYFVWKQIDQDATKFSQWEQMDSFD